jgi:hypothetical protein
MLIFLSTFLPTLSSILPSRAALQLENLALRHQVGVLQRSARKRPKLTTGDRLLWVWLSRIWSDWRSALAIGCLSTIFAKRRLRHRAKWRRRADKLAPDATSLGLRSYGQAPTAHRRVLRYRPRFVPAGVRYGAGGGPNQVVSASASPCCLRSPTHATYPSGRINTAVGAATTPTAGSSHAPP